MLRPNSIKYCELTVFGRIDRVLRIIFTFPATFLFVLAELHHKPPRFQAESGNPMVKFVEMREILATFWKCLRERYWWSLHTVSIGNHAELLRETRTMCSVREFVLGFLIANVSLSYPGILHSVEPEGSSVVGDLMTTLFSPVIAAEAKTMAVLQRTSLLDRISRNRSLEIALLIDGTESMSDELEGVRKQIDSMIDDLQRVLEDRVKFQIVIYRDAGAPAGIVEFVLPANGKEFSADREQMTRGLERLVVETGAPYFLEPVDVGLYQTIAELPWSTNDDAARWILLVGDAPPFDDGFSEPENQAERKYSDQQLLQLAQQKGIVIHSILCRSREADLDAYKKVLNRTQRFFSSLSEATGGSTIDLSNESDQMNIRMAAKRAAVEYRLIEPISEADIEGIQTAAAAQVNAANAMPARPIRIAVLPFMPQQESAFLNGSNPFDKAKNPTNYLVNQIVKVLDSIGVEGVSDRNIEPAARDSRKEGKRLDLLATRIGERVNADYVICSNQINDKSGKTNYEYAMLATDKGEYVVKQRTKAAAVATNAARASVAIVNDLAEAILASAPSPSLAARDLRTAMSKATRQNPKLRQVSLSEVKEVEEAIIRAQSALDGVVDFELLQEVDASDKAILESLVNAEREIGAALKIEPNNPVANLVLSNIRMSEILLDPNGPNVGRKRSQSSACLELAKRGASSLTPTELAELEADLALLDGQNETAISKYVEMEKSQGSLAASLRARWMLMGLYAGDWGVGTSTPSLVNAKEARAAAIRILALHPTSKHALRLRNTLRISAINPESASPALPLKNPHGLQ